MPKYAHCAGVIVFDNDQTIIVTSDIGHCSFPKGKRERGETEFQAALRELQEETGLTQDMIEFVNDTSFDEINDKGNITVKYFVAKLCKLYSPYTKFIFNPEELVKVEWVPIQEVYKLDGLLERRKNILRTAFSLLEN